MYTQYTQYIHYIQYTQYTQYRPYIQHTQYTQYIQYIQYIQYTQYIQYMQYIQCTQYIQYMYWYSQYRLRRPPFIVYYVIIANNREGSSSLQCPMNPIIYAVVVWATPLSYANTGHGTVSTLTDVMVTSRPSHVDRIYTQRMFYK